MAQHQHTQNIVGDDRTEEFQMEKVENLSDVNLVAEEALSDAQLKVEKRAIRKTDFRIVPVLGACYAISAIGRINISAARIAGMDTELGFNIGSRYSIALIAFFITYFIFQIPSNIVLRKVGAANWLSFLCFSWGVVTLSAGFSRRWTDIIICRLLLGFSEAGFLPGCVFLISCWYTRYEVQKRLAAFYAINIFANGLGSILAYGIMQLNGKFGYMGWRWIFIVNGSMTIFLSVLGRFLIVDFPDKVHKSRRPFLTVEEVQAIQDKLNRDRQDAEYDEVTGRKFIEVCGRWEVWFFALAYFSVSTIVYALAFFIPIILKGMGYSAGMSLLLFAPPALAAVPWVLLVSYLADKTRMRAPWIVMQAVLGLVGLMIIAYAKHNGIRYIGVFMGTAAANANIPTCLAWQANNIRGQSLRMVASGLQVAFGAIGGIFASAVFMQREAPLYRTGLWAVTGAQFYLILSTTFMVWHYRRQNKKADNGKIAIEGMESFRYTY